MPTTHAEIGQAARNLHAAIREALGGQALDIRDNATPFHPGQSVFYDHACPGDEVIQAPVLHAQLLALGFLGLAGQPSGRLIALPTCLLVQRRIGGIAPGGLIGRFRVVLCAGQCLVHHHNQCQAPRRDLDGMPTVRREIGKEIRRIERAKLGPQVNLQIPFGKGRLDNSGCGLGNRGEWMRTPGHVSPSLHDKDSRFERDGERVYSMALASTH